MINQLIEVTLQCRNCREDAALLIDGSIKMQEYSASDE